MARLAVFASQMSKAYKASTNITPRTAPPGKQPIPSSSSSDDYVSQLDGESTVLIYYADGRQTVSVAPKQPSSSNLTDTSRSTTMTRNITSSSCSLDFEDDDVDVIGSRDALESFFADTA